MTQQEQEFDAIFNEMIEAILAILQGLNNGDSR